MFSCIGILAGSAPDISEEALQNAPSVSVFPASAQEFVQNPGGEGNRKDDGVKPDHLIGEHDGSVGAHVGGKADHHVQAAGAGGEIGAGDVEVAEFDNENGDEHPRDEHQQGADHQYGPRVPDRQQHFRPVHVADQHAKASINTELEGPGKGRLRKRGKALEKNDGYDGSGHGPTGKAEPFEDETARSAAQQEDDQCGHEKSFVSDKAAYTFFVSEKYRSSPRGSASPKQGFSSHMTLRAGWPFITMTCLPRNTASPHIVR